MRMWLLCCVGIFLFACVAQSGARPPQTPVMLVVGEICAPPVHAGDTARVSVPIRVAPGYHVNANPASSEDYIPLEVKLDSAAGLRVGAAEYPKGKTWRLEGGTEDLWVYGGDVTVTIPVVLSPNAGPGEHVLHGSVDYQACDNQVCFFPETRPITLKLEVLKAE